jgi:hypothetical protein
MLVLMTLTHLPTRFSQYTGEPFGFVSSAEGFVFLSAFMVGWIHVARAKKNANAVQPRAMWRRAFILYACQIGLLLFLLMIVAPIGTAKVQPAITDLVSFFHHEPLTALSSGLVLVYDPPLLDILPLYIPLMLLTPAVLAWSLRRGWAPILGISFGLWILAQFGVGRTIYQAIAGATRFDMPYAETGAFSLLAWQLLWIVGLWMGSAKADRDERGIATPGWLVAPAAVVAFVFLVWRHAIGEMPFPSGNELNTLFDKWHLSPLRLLDFLALLVVTIRWGSTLASWFTRPFLSRLGAASLPVFCAHLVICLMALAFFGNQYDHRSWQVDAALLIGTFAALYAVAETALRITRFVEERGNANRTGIHPPIPQSTISMAGNLSH